MKIRDVSIEVEMGLWEDDCGNPCVYLKNPDDEYLSCHEDGKHIFWNDVEDDEAWAWEMWYPACTDNGVILKSYHDTYMTSDSEEDGRMWQCDEHSDVYVDMTKSQYDKMMNGDYVESDDEEDDVEQDEETHKRVWNYIESLDDYYFSVLHIITSLGGSLVLGLAFTEGDIERRVGSRHLLTSRRFSVLA